MTVTEAYTDKDGVLVNSAQFTGMKFLTHSILSCPEGASAISRIMDSIKSYLPDIIQTFFIVYETAAYFKLSLRAWQQNRDMRADPLLPLNPAIILSIIMEKNLFRA